MKKFGKKTQDFIGANAARSMRQILFDISSKVRKTGVKRKPDEIKSSRSTSIKTRIQIFAALLILVSLFKLDELLIRLKSSL